MALITLPGRSEGEKVCKWIEGVFTEGECKTLIELAETKGFEPASLVLDEKGQTIKNPRRTNDRVSLFDNELSAKLYQRLKMYCPAAINLDEELWEIHSCNVRVSFLRYNPGEYYAPHVDVPYEDDNIHHKLRSFVTIQLYLNENFTGGATTFIQEVGYKFIHERKELDVIPKTGAVLLFEHELLHTGKPVLHGQKYTIRTDIMYKRRDHSTPA